MKMRHLCWLCLVVGMLAGSGQAAEIKAAGQGQFSAYLMAYFGPAEKLFHAVSEDARHWTALDSGKPVFDAEVRLRDPYVHRVKGTFHMVHTKGWDHPTIFH